MKPARIASADQPDGISRLQSHASALHLADAPESEQHAAVLALLKFKKWNAGDKSTPPPQFAMRRTEPRPGPRLVVDDLAELACGCRYGVICERCTIIQQRRDEAREAIQELPREKHTPLWLREHREGSAKKAAARAATKAAQPPSAPTVTIVIHGEPVVIHLEAVNEDYLDECAQAVGNLARFAAILATHPDDDSALVSTAHTETHHLLVLLRQYGALKEPEAAA